MNVLIVTHSLPYPPTSGGAIRTHGIVEGLHRAGHTITLLCFDDGDAPTPDHLQVVTVPYGKGRSKLARLFTLLFTRNADIAQRFYTNDFAAQLRALLAAEPFDLIQFEGIESVCYLPVARAAQPAAKLSFDTFNAEYALQHSIFTVDKQKPGRWVAALYSYIQVGRVRRFEAAMCSAADIVFAVSEEDATLLAPLRPDGQIQVVHSGIWVQQYTDTETTLALKGLPLVFTGSMGYRPNVDAALWFADEVLPAVQRRFPDVHFYIVGKDPHPRLNVLRVRQGITLTGRVESVLPYLQKAAVFVVPLRMGSGTRLKLLEAMAARCAIVATPTASAGLNDAVKTAMHIANDADAMAAALINLLEDPDRRDVLRVRTLELVRKHYDWSVLVPRLLAAYRQIGLDC